MRGIRDGRDKRNWGERDVRDKTKQGIRDGRDQRSWGERDVRDKGCEG